MLVPQLQVATKKPPTTIDEPLHLEPIPTPSAKDIKSKPLSLEMFNKVASDLNTKGIINLKNTTDTLLKNHQSLFRTHLSICLTL